MSVRHDIPVPLWLVFVRLNFVNVEGMFADFLGQDCQWLLGLFYSFSWFSFSLAPFSSGEAARFARAEPLHRLWY